MDFIHHDLAIASDNAGPHLYAIDCGNCGAPAELLAAFYLCPGGVDEPLNDDEASRAIALVDCVACGLRMQLKPLDCHVND
jgi:hypothetical protein